MPEICFIFLNDWNVVLILIFTGRLLCRRVLCHIGKNRKWKSCRTSYTCSYNICYKCRYCHENTRDSPENEPHSGYMSNKTFAWLITTDGFSELHLNFHIFSRGFYDVNAYSSKGEKLEPLLVFCFDLLFGLAFLGILISCSILDSVKYTYRQQNIL